MYQPGAAPAIYLAVQVYGNQSIPSYLAVLVCGSQILSHLYLAFSAFASQVQPQLQYIPEAPACANQSIPIYLAVPGCCCQILPQLYLTISVIARQIEHQLCTWQSSLWQPVHRQLACSPSLWQPGQVTALPGNPCL
jgi:hypothetical protein